MPDPFDVLRPYDAVGAYLHTSSRLKARHDLSLTPDQYLRLCRCISGHLPYLKTAGSGPQGRVKLRYRIWGKAMPVVFDLHSHLIVTVLDDELPPLDAPEPKERKPHRKRRGKGKEPMRKWTRYDD